MGSTLTTKNGSMPLQSVTADISIVDVLARVTLSEHFLHQPLAAISPSAPSATIEYLEAIYTFPVPPGAAVCAFEAILDNGTTIVGVVKEKDEAKKEYDQAISEGRQAALAVHERTDEFKISVGAIPPNANVTVKLTFVIELLDDSDVDQVRFVLPTTIAPKYGSTTSYSSVSQSADYKLTLNVSIEMAQPIHSIASPSHSIRVDIGTLIPPSSDSTSPSSNFNSNHAYVSLTSESYLDRDFVLTITAAGLDSPRGMSEAFQAPSHAFAPSTFTTDGISPDSIPDPTTAIALTLVPRFNLAPVASQEYIFVCDRSGSMDGFKIKALQSALQLLLRSLPTNNTFLQIVSFGSDHSSLFADTSGRELKSVLFDPWSLKRASEHVDTFSANYGGTEIRETLADGVFKVRRMDVPTAVFVLTDGEVEDLGGVLNTIRLAVSASSRGSAPVRVFTLGIGNAVDAAMIGGMARVGNGIAQFAGENERIEGKVMKLLRAARVPGVDDVRVDWGLSIPSVQTAENDEAFEMIDNPSSSKTVVPDSDQPVALFDPLHVEPSIPPSFSEVQPAIESLPSPVKLIPFAFIQQSPSRGTIPILYSGSRIAVYAIIQTSSPPPLVTLTGRTSLGQQLELAIPIQALSPSSLTFSSLRPAPLIHTLAARCLIEDVQGSMDLPPRVPSGVHIVNPVYDSLKAQTVRLGITYSLASKYTSFVAVEIDENPEGGFKAQSRRVRTVLVSTRPDRGGGQARSLFQVSVQHKLEVEESDDDMGLDLFDSDSSVGEAEEVNDDESMNDAPQMPRFLYQEISDSELRSEHVSASESEASSNDDSPESLDMTDKIYEKLIRLQSFNGSFSTLPAVVRTLRLPATSATFPSDILPGFIQDGGALAEALWAACLALAWLGLKVSQRKDEWLIVSEKTIEYLTSGISEAVNNTVYEGRGDEVMDTIRQKAREVVSEKEANRT